MRERERERTVLSPMTTAAKGVVAFMVLLSLALSACGGDNKNPLAPTPVPAPTPAPTPTPPPAPTPTPLAPADEAAFNEGVVGKRVLSALPAYYTDFVSPGRFRETGGAEIWTGNYTYRNTGPNTGTLTFNYDDGDRCTTSLTFDSTTSGTSTYTCNDGTSGSSNWRLAPTSTPTPTPTPTPPTADIYQPLAGLRVSPGRVQFLFASAGQCIVLNSNINGVTYTTHTSKWQRRDSSTTPWTDISGTERDGLCAYSPSDPGEYRLVGEVTIDGTRGNYSSENTITR